jgi:hypothetical protein
MAKTKTLYTVRYSDDQRNVYLTNYADTIVYGGTGGVKTLYAIRFGGYPEQTEAMAAAIYGGGTVDVTFGDRTITLRALAKRYAKKISHDGVYAEAAMYASEDPGETPNSHGNKHDGALPERDSRNDDLPPRSICIYTAPDDADALYDAIDKAVSVPLIPEFADWLTEELKRRGDLKPLQVLSVSVKTDAWILRCESGDSNIIGAVEYGLKNGDIAIPGVSPQARSAIEDIKTVTEYLTQFGPALAERIKTLFTPMYDPGIDTISPEVAAINEHIREKTGYTLYSAQLAAAEAMKRRLSAHKAGVIVAECGSGKTKIGLAAMAAAAGLTANQKQSGRTKTFNIVLCPAHITEKWVREINESLPNTFAGIVSDITGFDRLYSDYERSGKSCYAVISKENARDGYTRTPAVLWNESEKTFVCPDCGKSIMMDITDGDAKYTVPSDQFFFKRENKYNHACPHCDSMLWTALNPHMNGHKWAKIGGYGYVYAQMASQHMGKVNNPLFEDKIERIMSNEYKTAGAHRKYPLATYIKKKYRGRIDGLIVDELHNYSNDSGQGDAMAELYGTAKKVIGMTATLINGYASGIFHLLYRLAPGLMEKDGQNHSAPNDFAKQYGVIQNVYIQDESNYNTNRRTAKRKKSTKQLPGVSPLVYTRFLLEHAAFLSLTDMGKELPEYEEIPIALELPNDVKKVCDAMRDTLVRFMRSDKKAANKILSAYLNLLIAYPDQPYGHQPIIHPIRGEVILDPPDIGSFDTIMPKDKVVLDIANKKISSGGKLLIYTSWTRLDTQRKLYKLLTDAGYRTAILPATVRPKDRERWVQGKLDEGIRVLITNPNLIETGLDLNAFTTLIFYDTGYKLFTLRQAARRSYRINQMALRIEVYMLYYIDTMQHKAMKLMGTKLAVASIIEGGFSEEGLAAMSQCEDMTTLMAKELMLGIRDSVDDVSASFRRMSAAGLKQDGIQEQCGAPELVVFAAFGENSGDGSGGTDIDAMYSGARLPGVSVRLVELTFAAGIANAAATAAQTEMEAVLSFETPSIQSKTRISDGQLTIFDMLDMTA